MEAYNNIKLLIVDLGASVVLKNEGPECQLKIGGNTVDLSVDDVRVWQSTFAELKQDLDNLDGEKPPWERPFPRLEKKSHGVYTVCLGPGCKEEIQHSIYVALSELAGKPLPVWAPKKGEWLQLLPFTERLEDGISTTTYDLVPDLKIWRYTQ